MSVNLSWSAPLVADTNGIIREYHVNLVEVDTAQLLTYTTTNLFITIQSLHPFYTYNCSVSAFTVDTGPFSNEAVISLPQDGKFNMIIMYMTNMAVMLQLLVDTLNI